MQYNQQRNGISGEPRVSRTREKDYIGAPTPSFRDSIDAKIKLWVNERPTDNLHAAEHPALWRSRESNHVRALTGADRSFFIKRHQRP